MSDYEMVVEEMEKVEGFMFPNSELGEPVTKWEDTFSLINIPVGKSCMTDQEKIEQALDIIFNNAGYDGGHHKQWCIDQVVRKLLGDDEGKYKEWVANYEKGEDGPKTYEWDEGIPA